MPSQSVLVIGGGLAGLSSAIALADAGLQVRLVEKRPHLGGRATSYTLPDGSEVDNCQHVTLGCCTNLADFYARVGAGDKIRFYDKLYFVDAKGKRSTIEAAPLPPPLHMMPAFLLFGALTFADKRGIANAMMAIATAGGNPPNIDGISMLDWLQRMKQTRSAIERFWRVVLVSALDEELAQTDARYGIEVFWKAFLGSRSGYRVGIPKVPLADLYDGCRDAVVRKGGEVRMRANVREIRVSGEKFAGAALADGTETTADACICAVPQNEILELLPAEFSAPGAALEGVRQIKSSPITGVHLWYDRRVMTEPFLTLLDHTTQWVFNKTALSETNEKKTGQSNTGSGAGENADGQYLQLVISASYDLVPKSRQEIIDLCVRELADVLPATRDAKLVKATVVKEVNATFSPGVGVDRFRPQQQSPIKNLILAGDWTRTGWPSTMEGAVRSGYLAAEAVLAGFGEPRKFLQADLPFEGLCKFWAGRNDAVRS
jgi:squalene-associated FAD-dependent desaturase